MAALLLVFQLTTCRNSRETADSDGTSRAAQATESPRRTGEPAATPVNPGIFGYIRTENRDGVIITYRTGNATNVVVPDTIESLPVVGIQTGLFQNDREVQSVTLPVTVTAIPNDAFRGCNSLVSINMPGVTTIGLNAFRDCTSLTTVSLPRAATIGNNAFYNCSSLANITLPEAATIGNEAFYNCYSLLTVTMPGVTTIGVNAFRGCNSLHTVSIPGVMTIGSEAFRACISLVKVEVSERLTTAGFSAFRDCINLSDFNVPTNLTQFPRSGGADNTFFRCHKLPFAARDRLIAQGYSGAGLYQ